MTITETANALGWNFSHICYLCSIKYHVYKNPNFAGSEMKIRPAKGLAKIYQSGRQIGFATATNLEEILRNNQLIQS